MNNKYKLIEEKYIDEVASLVKVYEHIKTKAQVLVLSNDDENKAFGIGFRTIPKDSTGVAHIVEHCVLSGSRKYTTREPFMDLIKSSMQTFLNAMTFSDKTIYPVSSRNEKDFYNLMDVYLDAVFYPRMYEKKEIFLQEGWHYEIDEETEELKYNGVVYNEMKGVYSDPQNIVSDIITFNLHRDSSYGVDSGGDPAEIPSLSYENFLDFHRKHYHPSNSYIYLYGNLDMEKALSYIDENYLSNFEKETIDSEIILNEPFKKQKFISDTYSASESEMGENKDYLTYSWCMGSSTDKLDLFMRNFLSELLIDSESAPLKMAILKANLAEDVYAETSASEVLDLSIVAKNTDVKRKDEFKDLIESTLKEIISKGINKDLLRATLNKFEFAFREGGGTQRSIIYYIRALNSWLYGESPIDGLEANEMIEDLNSKIDSDFFEKYIEEKLLNNNYSLITAVEPELNKSKREEDKLKSKLQNYKSSLSKEEIEKIVAEQNNLIDFQMTEDSPKDKNTIPSLELSDINKSITHIPREEIENDFAKVLLNEQFTNSISYVTVLFDTSGSVSIDEDSKYTFEELQNYSLLTDLIGKVSTEKYNYEDLDNEIYKVMGGFTLNPTSYSDYNDKNNIYKYAELKFKVLDEKLEDALKLIDEIIQNSILTDKNRIKEILLIEKSDIESSILQNGHSIAVETVKSYYSQQGMYNNIVNGLELYFYLADLLDNFDERWESFRESLISIKNKIFNKNNLIINYTGSKETLNDNLKYFKDFVGNLSDEKYDGGTFFYNTSKSQGFTTSANVQYVSKGCDLSELGLDYNGSLSVLANILSTDYLHNNIRAKGGAYGAGVKLTLNSDILTYSYRDPNLKKTIDVYDNMYEFLENLNLTDEELKNYIIGTMNAFDPMLSPAAKGDLNLTRYISNITEDKMSEFKNQALNTTVEQLKSYAPILKESMEKNYLCVIGGEEIIKENSKLFNEIINLKR